MLHDIRAAYKRLSLFRRHPEDGDPSKLRQRRGSSDCEVTLPTMEERVKERLERKKRRSRIQKRHRLRRESVQEIKELVLQNQGNDTVQRAYRLAKLSTKHVDRQAFEKAERRVKTADKHRKTKHKTSAEPSHLDRVPHCVCVFRAFFCAPLSQGGLFPTDMPTRNPKTGVPLRWAQPIYPRSMADAQEMAGVLYYLFCFSQTRKLKEEHVVVGALLEALADPEQDKWVQVDVLRDNGDGTFRCQALAHGIVDLSEEELRNLSQEHKNDYAKTVLMKKVPFKFLRHRRSNVPESSEGVYSYLLEVVAFDDVVTAVKTLNPWKHSLDKKNHGRAAADLGRFIWRHVISVRHPVLAALWETGMMGHDPDAVIDKYREARGLAVGLADRAAGGYAFSDVYGSFGNKGYARPKTAAAELAPFEGLDASLQLLLLTVFKALDIVHDGRLDAREVKAFWDFVDRIDVTGRGEPEEILGAEDQVTFRPRSPNIEFRGQSLDWLRRPYSMEQPDPRVLAGFRPTTSPNPKASLSKAARIERERATIGDQQRPSTAGLPTIGDRTMAGSNHTALEVPQSNQHSPDILVLQHADPTVDLSASNSKSAPLHVGSEGLTFNQFCQKVRKNLERKCEKFTSTAAASVEQQRKTALYFFVTKIQRWLSEFRHKQILKAMERDSGLLHAVRDAGLNMIEAAKLLHGHANERNQKAIGAERAPQILKIDRHEKHHSERTSTSLAAKNASQRKQKKRTVLAMVEEHGPSHRSRRAKSAPARRSVPDRVRFPPAR
eukprot:INCI5054.11.p1 GENE.INCI5054.11~~INCI5054.11.p1  ORF type:complete len:777 (+),score=109.14 INCI5054.11:166-2496(+)